MQNSYPRQNDFCRGFLHVQYGLKHNSGTVLDKLAHGMKVGG